MRRSVLVVAVLSLAAAAAGCSSSSPSGSGSTSSSSQGAGSTSTAVTSGATTTAPIREIKAPDGSKIRVTPPSTSTNYSAPVVYADPSTVPGEPFAASGSVKGVPLEQLGSWTQAPPGVKAKGGSAPSTTAPTGATSTDSASTGDTSDSASTGSSTGSDSTVVSGAETGSTDLCAGQLPSSNCVIYSTGWVRLAHDAGTHGHFTCPADHPYVLGTWNGGTPLGADSGAADTSATDSAAPGTAAPGEVENFSAKWSWQRDHWTITVWDPGPDPDNGIDYWAQNWNTVFGDAWHFQISIPCGTSPTPEPSN